MIRAWPVWIFVCWILLWSFPLEAQLKETDATALPISEEASLLAAPDAGSLFVAANAAYESGDYPTAIGHYRELIEQGSDGGRVRFNLGNAFLRNGELGRAIAELRRASILLPRDEDIRANLEFARQSAKDAIEPPQPAPVWQTLFFWHHRLSPSELAALAVILSLLFWGLALVRLFRRQSEILSWTWITVLVFLVGTFGSIVAHRYFSPAVAVVVPLEIDAFTAPDTDSVVRFKLHAGTELRIRDEREGWVRIALPDEQQGWIETSWIERVEG